MVGGDPVWLDFATSPASSFFNANNLASALNAFAWRLLTDAPYAGHCQKVALEAARAMAEIPDWRSHWRVDTLALACFENGLVDEAVELQREAVDSADAAARARYELRLERYRSAQR